MSFFKKISLGLIAAPFLFSATVFAGMISGKVTSSDPSTRKVTISTINAATGQSVQSDVWVDAGASLKGIASLSEIKSGDTLWLEAEADSEGNLRASSLTKA